MNHVTKTTHLPKNGIIHGAKGVVRLRRDCEDSLDGASKADRRFLKSTITVLDRVISLHIELDLAIDRLFTLAGKKRPLGTARPGRVGR